MNIRLPARIGAFACLGVAVAMAARALRGTSQPTEAARSRPETVAPADPLEARLRRCQQAGEAAGSDRDCLAAWAENRRRFLGLDRARPAEPASSPVMDQVAPSAPAPDTGPAAAQPQEH
ncbi:putative entry exclusion protein TrbK-alt [Sphingomonas sp.]|uniref:putative entry exclusion protein TrbK-alt n=1 Tax=Sphingomonas sp. TaxID=28214 RepID=UPI002ED8F925